MNTNEKKDVITDVIPDKQNIRRLVDTAWQIVATAVFATTSVLGEGGIRIISARPAKPVKESFMYPQCKWALSAKQNAAANK